MDLGYDVFYLIMWVGVVIAGLTGMFWWIPKYVHHDEQENVTLWVMSSMTIIAVFLNVGGAIHEGEGGLLVYGTILAAVITFLTTLVYVQWYVPTYVEEKEDVIKHQELALNVMSILMIFYDVGSDALRDLFPTHPSKILTAGRRLK